MKKTLLTFLSFICFVTLIQAQLVSVDKAELSFNVSATDTDIKAEFIVTNNSDQELSLLWSRDDNSIPAGWITWMCDNNLCYGPGLSACPDDKANIVAPNETMLVQYHVNPNGIEQNASIPLTITSLEFPDSTLLELTTNLSFATSIDDVQEDAISIYPNPSADYFRVYHDDRIQSLALYSIVGKPVKTFDYANGKSYHIALLPDGMYLVRFYDNKKDVIKTMRLSKRSS